VTLFQSFELLRDWTIQLGYNSRVTGEIGKGCCSSESSVVIIGISAMSMSSSSASSSGGGSGHPRQAMGARPKIIAQQQKEEQTGQEWNSNWNPTLSAQGVASNGSQPPSAQCDPPCVVWHRQPGLTRGSSDCSLDSVSASSAWRQQGTQPPGITHHRSGSHLQLSSSNFSSDSSIHSTTQANAISFRFSFFFFFLSFLLVDCTIDLRY